MKEEHRLRMLADTAEARAPFIEDLEYLSKLLASPTPTRGDIRRASAIIRRILVERDAVTLASPRIGKLHIDQPDNAIAYKSIAKRSDVVFFLSSGAPLFKVYWRAVALTNSRKMLHLPDFNPDRTATVRFDDYIKQKVLYFRGDWITRIDIIKYAANVASGVHSGTPKEQSHLILSRARHMISWKRTDDNTIQCVANHYPDGDENPPLVYDPNAIDPILVELLSAAYFFLNSADVMVLEATLRQELGR